MKHNYPLLIFGIVCALLVALQQLPGADPTDAQPATPETLSTPPSPPIKPNGRDTTEVDASSAELSDEAGVIWHFKANPALDKQIRMCKLIPLPNGAEVLAAARYWYRSNDGVIQILTPRQDNVLATVTAHLDVLACIYHQGIEATDPITERQFDETNFPRNTSGGEFALDVFFGVIGNEKTAQSVGMARLGLPEIRVLTQLDKPQDIVWRLLTLSLTKQPLEALLKFEPLSLRIDARTPALLTIIATKKSPKTVPKSAKRPSVYRRPPLRKHTKINSHKPSIPLLKPTSMPEYR